MDTVNVGDISNGTLIKTLGKEELCACLKNAKLNYSDIIDILHQIRSKYEIIDRLDIIRQLSIDFDEIKETEITNILEFLKIIGNCIECSVFDKIVKVIESSFSRIKQQEKTLSRIQALEIAKLNSFDVLYSIFNKIADEDDAETMSIAIKEKLHLTTNDVGEDVFSYSCRESDFNLVHLMIECGNDSIHQFYQLLFRDSIINISNFKDIIKTPGFNENENLIHASQKGHYDIVKLLLTVPGIDVNAKDDDSNTALIFASMCGRHEVVKLLLTVPGIDVNAKDSENKTALILASTQGHHEIVKLLLAFPGIDVDARNIDNKTALISASIYGYHEVVKLLLAFPGIDVDARDIYNKTAFDWALLNHHHEVVELFLTAFR